MPTDRDGWRTIGRHDLPEPLGEWVAYNPEFRAIRAAVHSFGRDGPEWWQVTLIEYRPGETIDLHVYGRGEDDDLSGAGQRLAVQRAMAGWQRLEAVQRAAASWQGDRAQFR